MEPFEEDQLTPGELDSLLREWKSPAAPARLRAAVFAEHRPWWVRLWTVSIRVPLPVACCLGMLIAAGIWRMSRPAPPPAAVVVRTQRVEVPVVHDRIVTKYVYRKSPEGGLTFKELRPVSELRPVIIRSDDAKN
jgi:hypothetical protein